jgi:Outer membrane protein beta-barrel domain
MIRPFRHLVLGIGTLLATSLHAQERWTIEARGGVAIPTAKLSGTELSTGTGLGATVAYRIAEHLHLYGGWDWFRFPADQSFAGAKIDFEQTGYTYGAKFVHPVSARSSVSYMLHAGGLYTHIEVESNSGGSTLDTGHGLGWEAGGGLAIALTPRWQLTPALRYRAQSRDFKIASSTVSGDLQYVTFELGAAIRF